MTMTPDTFNPNIAHIKDGDDVFQVLNADGTDWDEAATRAAYEAWKAAQG
jgi:hypothetical protein